MSAPGTCNGSSPCRSRLAGHGHKMEHRRAGRGDGGQPGGRPDAGGRRRRGGRGPTTATAQARCPHVVLVDEDRAHDAHEFEPVIRAVAELSPCLDVIEPGWITLDARGPSRYFGGEAMLASRLGATVTAEAECQRCWRCRCRHRRRPVHVEQLAAAARDPPARTAVHRRRRLRPLLCRSADWLVAGVG